MQHLAHTLFEETLPLVDAHERIRGMLCILLKTRGRKHPATRVVVQHLVRKQKSV